MEIDKQVRYYVSSYQKNYSICFSNYVRFLIHFSAIASELVIGSWFLPLLDRRPLKPLLFEVHYFIENSVLCEHDQNGRKFQYIIDYHMKGQYVNNEKDGLYQKKILLTFVGIISLDMTNMMSGKFVNGSFNFNETIRFSHFLG